MINCLKSIDEQWQGFAEMVFRGCKPSDTQREEMKKSFFAGAWAMFAAMEEIGEPHVSEAKALAYLEARRQECLQFKNRLMAEYSERN